MWTLLAQKITQATGQYFEIRDRRSIGGGSINQAYAVSDGDRTFFVKLNQASRVFFFETEVQGLLEIAHSQTIRVPHVLCWGTLDQFAYLVMEYLPAGTGSAQAWYAMGQQLAALHRVVSSRGFGFEHDNVIGETPQPNGWFSNWTDFYLQKRLGFQFQLAHRRGGHFPKQAQFLTIVPELLAGHQPEPVLVHGDLWSGNALVTQAGEPVIVDPAVYYGDREVDLAMTELFGRFPAQFYQGYETAYPLPPGCQTRKTLYNLYHILNHFNQFGGGYLSQANQMIEQLLAGTGKSGFPAR